MSLCLFYAYLCSKKDMNKIILSVFALLLYSCGTTKTNIVTRENLLYLHLNEKHTLSNIVVERIVIPKEEKLITICILVRFSGMLSRETCCFR